MSTIEREHVTELPAVLDPRVERGAALLDEKMPGWHNKINVDDIQIHDTRKCILGQCGDFGDGLRTLGLKSTGAVVLAHGFGGVRAFEQDWRLAILARRT